LPAGVAIRQYAALDAAPEILDEVRNAARSLVEMVRLMRTGHYLAPDRDLVDPRQK